MKGYSKEDINHLLIQHRKYKKMIKSYQENDCTKDYLLLKEKYQELQQQMEQLNHTASETIQQYKQELQQKDREIDKLSRMTGWNTADDSSINEDGKPPSVQPDKWKRPSNQPITDSVAFLSQQLYYLDQKLTEITSGQPLNKKRKENDQAMDEHHQPHDHNASSTFFNQIKVPIQQHNLTDTQEAGKQDPKLPGTPGTQDSSHIKLLEKLQAEMKEMKELMKESNSPAKQTETHSHPTKSKSRDPYSLLKPVANPYHPSTKQPQFHYRNLQGASVIPVIDNKGKQNHAHPIKRKQNQSKNDHANGNHQRTLPPINKLTSTNPPPSPTDAQHEQPIWLKSDEDKRAYLQKLIKQEEANVSESATKEQAVTSVSSSDNKQPSEKQITTPTSIQTTEHQTFDKNRAKMKTRAAGESTDIERPKIENVKQHHSHAAEEKKSIFKKFWDKINP
ncbi:hypothetical protein [Virgibacillus senegalensis]|uniref:hypothetical protein n=1 Tax=Virgibacillus senegalensis TaxID=1499679 RepID=UPI00069DF5B7|nr:hypothetical protein [Virgibacillus senegalensis]